MTHEVIKADGMPRPAGHYSPAVRVGNTLFVSAQNGIDPASGTVPDGGFEAECRQAFANIESVLKASNSSLACVVKATVLYTDIVDLPIINKVFATIFPTDPPARTAAIVGLPGGRRISIETVAVVPSLQERVGDHNESYVPIPAS
ncbi:Rid family hydrolase [Phytohabitans sp. ZYX-F-186]|uniref:Rid family hydrolase n=1 Tax=Phytohabitans maris TaxID=3071409 RepID=A0ABU0ZQM6_9ACTN|nr:Rid family hydrolase [Phytohabitans sp. ZYX-F-186]MDQ7908747.1 Rid family hydrolase [Phytohabitans sp. ZYX-F-186]